MITRRQFVLSAGACAAALLLPTTALLARRRQFPDVPLAARKLKDGIWVITERGGNSLLISTTDGSILIDTKITEVADELLAKTSELSSGAPKTIINTHHHFDHVGSNFMFSEKSQIVAHKSLAPRIEATLNERVRPALAQQARLLRAAGKTDEATAIATKAQSFTAKQFSPTTEYANRHSMQLGNTKLMLHHFGAGHTDNDSIIHLQEHNIIHMGDLLFHKMHAFVDRAGGAKTIGWQNALRRAMEMCDEKTIVIPGHGEVTDRSALPRQIEYFDQLREVVNKAMKEGKSKQEIAALKPDVFQGLGFEQILPMALTATYEELTADSATQ